MDNKEIHLKDLIDNPESSFIELDIETRPLLHQILSRKFSFFNSTDREEIIQETFIKIFTNRENLFKNNPDLNLKIYLRVVLNNIAIDKARKEKFNNPFDKVLNNKEKDEGAIIDVSENIEIYEKILSELSKENKKIVEMIAYGYSSFDISEKTNKSHMFTMNRIKKIRKNIKKLFEKYNKEGDV